MLKRSTTVDIHAIEVSHFILIPFFEPQQHNSQNSKSQRSRAVQPESLSKLTWEFELPIANGNLFQIHCLIYVVFPCPITTRDGKTIDILMNDATVQSQVHKKQPPETLWATGLLVNPTTLRQTSLMSRVLLSILTFKTNEEKTITHSYWKIKSSWLALVQNKFMQTM